ncbi:MAG: MFS transporter [Burkholderiales bacterium]
MTGTDHSRRLLAILVCGSVIVTLAMGMRHGFGLFLQPMSADLGWNRQAFSFAIALQNLLWGMAQPFAGGLADRYGAPRVIVGGALLYAAGLALMTVSTVPLTLSLSGGLLIGLALSGVTYSVIYGVVGRSFPEHKRSQAMGMVAAAGSFGQFLLVPFEQWLIGGFGWSGALLALAAIALIMAPMALGLREPPRAVLAGSQTIRQALAEAFRNGSFWLLTAGYFVCGFQVVFIAIHLPAYLKDHGLAPHVAVTALALIGLFNIIGTWSAGQLGARLPKKYLLAGIYGLRSVVIIAFLLAPLSPMSVYLFASAIGVLWLSTIPLTNGIVAVVFGVRYLAMLGGFVFFSHQIGSFFGVWLGGLLYDRTGNYNVVWGIAIALGIFAMLINMPIREKPLTRLATA